MKKLAIVVLAVLFIAPAAMAKNWGAAVKLGVGQNNPKSMKDELNALDSSSYKELDKMPGYLSMEILHEWALNDEANKIGAKIGWDTYGENELKAYGLDYGKITEESDAFPFTVYFRRDNGVNKFSWFAGAGVTIMHTKVKGTAEYDGSFSKNKTFPHLVAGVEYRFTEVFALGLDARYNISAKVKKDGLVLSDRSGFGAALAGRFYF